MIRFFTLIILFTFTSAFTSLSTAASISIPEKIRVVLEDDASEMKISVRGPYRITTIETGQLLKEGKTFFDARVRPSKYGIHFGSEDFKIYGIEIVPERDGSIYLGKRLYRGSMQIMKTKKALLAAINVIELEDYLKGVLYHEVSHRWPQEAIKAQAIVSRTFALYQAEQNQNNYYYLKSDVSSQVYGGVYGEKYRTNKAVEQTKGEVLVYKGKLLPAFFHATCGGRTEDASRLWKVNSKPLRGVICPYCVKSPHFSWQQDIKLTDIEKVLRGKGYDVASITSIEAKGIDASGRVIKLRIRGSARTLNISAKDFRHAMGPSRIRSTDFTIRLKNGRAYFSGRGWGHGVGMCQWGAFSMAKKRNTAEQILNFYYPGAKIVKLTD